MTPEVQGKIAVLRSKVLDGTITLNEMQEAIIAMRQDRKGAAIASEKARKTKAKAVVQSAEDLLKEMEGL